MSKNGGTSTIRGTRVSPAVQHVTVEGMSFLEDRCTITLVRSGSRTGTRDCLVGVIINNTYGNDTYDRGPSSTDQARARLENTFNVDELSVEQFGLLSRTGGELAWHITCGLASSVEPEVFGMQIMEGGEPRREWCYLKFTCSPSDIAQWNARELRKQDTISRWSDCGRGSILLPVHGSRWFDLGTH
jgi:hypothetical protein